MDGLLVVDKPIGPTSHDVVARVRRVLRERRIGHTGTLDPMASGVLPLVVGRATRLARFVSQGTKRYDALVRLGVATDTYDAHGEPTGAKFTGELPARDAVERALDPFRGAFLQRPPAFSAKKIDGRRSYDLARARARGGTETDAPVPAVVPVTAHAIEIVNLLDDFVALRIVCSAGFYVRSLAHDLGRALGVGAHLAALRRTEAGGVGLQAAVDLAALEDPGAGRDRAGAALISIDRMLPDVPSVVLTDDGRRRASHGGSLGMGHVSGEFPRTESVAPAALFRLLDEEGALVAIGEWHQASASLHPAVVLM